MIRYKVLKIDAGQREFMKKCRACACMFCDYSEGYFCTFRGKKCPAGKEEYLKKIHYFKNKKL